MKKIMVFLLIIAILLMTGCGARQADNSTTAEPDIKIGVLGSSQIDENVRASMENYFSSLVSDINDDGKSVAELEFYDLTEPSYGYGAAGFINLMETFLEPDEITLFLATDEMVGDYGGAATLFKNNSDYFLELSDDGCGFDLSSSSLSSAIAEYWEEDTFPLYGFILDNDETETQELALELLESVLETEFTLNTDALQKSENFFDTDTAEDAVILTIGTLTDDVLVSALAAEYNATHSDYQIQIQCYADDDAELADAVEKVNIQLMTGDTPDILYLDSLDIKSFENTGLLLDLSEYIQEDSTIDSENYLMNIWELFSYQDKMYELIPCFEVYGLVGAEEILPEGNGWTMEDYNALQAQQGQLLSISADTLRAYMTRFAISPFIEPENAQCSFDSEEYIQTLEFIRDNGVETEESTALRCGVLHSVSDYAAYRDLYDSAKFIGYPNSEKTSPCAAALYSFGICASTEYSEACWEFFQFILSEDVQRQVISNFGIPISRRVLQEQLSSAQKPAEDDSSLFYGTETQPLEEDDAEYIEELLASIDCAAFRYADVQNILKEEITVFLSGEKDAGEIAEIIQNRVSIYLSEQEQ